LQEIIYDGLKENEMKSKSLLKNRLPFMVLIFALTITASAFSAGKAFAALNCFTDTTGHWAETFICWAKDNGITSGTAPGVYSPDDYVTRAQMAVFLNKTAALNRATGTQFDSLFGNSVAANSSTNFATVNLTAPATGALLVNGSLNLYCQSGLFPSCLDSSGNVYINVDGIRYNRQYFSIDGIVSSVNGGAWNSSNTAYIPVAPGVHTISLEVDNFAGSGGPTWVWSGGINVLFVPFNGTGATPVISKAPEGAPEPSTQGE